MTAFDAVGPSASGQVQATTAAFTWTHTPAGTPTEILVFLTVGYTGGATSGQIGSFASVTYGGVALTLLSSQAAGPSGSQTFGGMFMYGVSSKTASIPSGPQTVSIGAHTIATGATFSQTIGVSVSASGGGSGFGTPPTPLFGTGAGATLGITSTTSGGLCVAGAADGSGAETTTAGTQRWLSDQSSGSIGNTVGATIASAGGTTNLTFTWTSDFYAVMGVEVLSATAAGPPPFAAAPPVPPGWFPGSGPVTAVPGGIPFSVQPSPGYAPPGTTSPGVATLAGAGSLATAVIQGASATLAGTGTLTAAAVSTALVFAAAPPVPPGWFPGSGAATPVPGGIPFYSQPSPGYAPPLIPVITGLTGSGWTGYFNDQAGKPRLFQMIEDWGFPTNAGRYNSGAGVNADIDNYTSVRGTQKFTAMYTSPYGHTGLGGAFDDGRTWDGIYPFICNGAAGPIVAGTTTLTLNNSFWTRIDYLLARLAANGITMYLNLGMNLTLSGMYASASTAMIQAAGQAIATRYLSQPNIIWMIGDDFGPGTWETQETAFKTGVTAAGDTRPWSTENYQDTTSLRSLDGTTSMTWGIANANYNWYYGFQPTYFGVEYCYTEAATYSVPQLPALSGDTGWSADGTNDALMVSQMWWALSSGARGHGILGNTWNWPSNSESLLTGVAFIDTYMKTIRATFEALPNWQNLVPDTTSSLVTAGRGTRWTYNASPTQANLSADNYVTASKTADGTLALIYMSHASTITINTALLGTGYTATRYDPYTGTATPVTTGTTYNSGSWGNNSAGAPDWVLVLAGPAAGTSPGAATLTGTGSLSTAATLGAGTALGGAGSLGNLDITGAPATLGGAGTVTTAARQLAPATLGGTGSLTTAAVQGAIATLSGTGSLATAATQGVIASLQGAGSLSALATQLAPATLAGAGSLATAVTQLAPATLAGTGSILGNVNQGSNLGGQGSIGALATQLAPATLTGTGSLATAVTQLAPATLAGTGSLTAPASQLSPSTLAGAGSLGNLDITGAPATLGGTGALTTAAIQGAIATLSGTGSITGSVGQGSQLGGQGSIGALATQLAPATLAGTGSLTTAVTQLAPATLSGTGSLGNLDITGAPAALGGTGSLTTAARQLSPATLAGTGSLATAAVQGAPATLTGTGSLTAAGGPAGTATLTGTGSLSATGIVSGAAGATLAGTGSLVSLATLLATASLQGAGSVTAPAVQGAITILAGTGSLTALGTQHPPQVKGFITAAIGEAASIAAATGEAAGITAAVGEAASVASSVS